MKLQRKALKTLKQWKTTPDHKPLLIRGARQTRFLGRIGKTDG